MQRYEEMLINILQSGTFQGVDIRMSLSEVLERLGPPEDYATIESFFDDWPRYKASRGTEEIISVDYAQLEFIFNNADETLVYFSLEPTYDVNAYLPEVFDDGFITYLRGMNTNNFKEFVRNNNITCYKRNFGSAEALNLIVQKSSIQVVFDLEDNNDQLYSIYKSTWSSNCEHLTDEW